MEEENTTGFFMVIFYGPKLHDLNCFQIKTAATKTLPICIQKTSLAGNGLWTTFGGASSALTGEPSAPRLMNLSSQTLNYFISQIEFSSLHLFKG